MFIEKLTGNVCVFPSLQICNEFFHVETNFFLFNVNLFSQANNETTNNVCVAIYLAYTANTTYPAVLRSISGASAASLRGNLSDS